MKFLRFSYLNAIIVMFTAFSYNFSSNVWGGLFGLCVAVTYSYFFLLKYESKNKKIIDISIFNFKKNEMADLVNLSTSDTLFLRTVVKNSSRTKEEYRISKNNIESLISALDDYCWLSQDACQVERKELFSKDKLSFNREYLSVIDAKRLSEFTSDASGMILSSLHQRDRDLCHG
ncbi:TPA: hypothetical protein QHS04_000961 [Morganella morganii subsp. morganii]|nr:hypothetical protein [Morganella morganii subsp. morganii]